MFGGKKTVLITGASRGIGASLAQNFASQNYNVVINYNKSKDKALELLKKIRDFGGSAIALKGNVSEFDDAKYLVNKTLEEFGSIDVLINNAGIAHLGLLTDMSLDEWDEMIGTNLSPLFYTAKAVVPAMVHAKAGNIINISSMWGTVGASCEVAYSAAKGGVNSFTKALGKELALSGIAVNAIACGVVDTDMNGMLSAEEKQELSDEIPAGRFCKPEEIAEVALSIINAPSYMTGQVIGVDGGYI